MRLSANVLALSAALVLATGALRATAGERLSDSERTLRRVQWVPPSWRRTHYDSSDGSSDSSDSSDDSSDSSHDSSARGDKRGGGGRRGYVQDLDETEGKGGGGGEDDEDYEYYEDYEEGADFRRPPWGQPQGSVYWTPLGGAGNPVRRQTSRRPGAARRPQAQAQAPGRAPTKAPGRAPTKAAGGGGDRCGVTIEVQRIINGREAQRGEYPWQAAIVYERDGQRQARCGGALVHPRFVLTAAHCLDPNSIKGFRLVDVRLGLVDQRAVDKDALALAPDRQLLHPSYRAGTSSGGVRNENDIALLRLPRAAPYTEFIRPICLPSQQSSRQTNGTSTLVISGWGITEQGSFSEKLLFARVPAVESGACGRRLGVTVPASQLCAGGESADSCTGDSGGPLVQTAPAGGGDLAFVVVGLVSFGPQTCGTAGAPGAYTRVAPFVPWIQDAIRKNSGA